MGSSIASQGHDPDDENNVDPLAWACLMTLFVGIFTFLLGIFRLGFLDSLMSRALLRGFITGVALVVLLQQTIILLGLVKISELAGITEASTTVERLFFLIRHAHQSHPLSSIVSGVAVFVLLACRVLKSKINIKWILLLPEVLVVVVTSILLTYFCDWEHQGLDILGTIEGAGKIPLPSIPAFPENHHMKDLLVTAAMIAIIGFVESVVIAKTYSSRHNYSVSANRELVALGVANTVAGKKRSKDGQKGISLKKDHLLLCNRSDARHPSVRIGKEEGEEWSGGGHPDGFVNDLVIDKEDFTYSPDYVVFSSQ